MWEQCIPDHTEYQTENTMENSRLQLWHYDSPVLSYFHSKEEPRESLEFSNSENNGYSIKEIQTSTYRDGGYFMEDDVSPPQNQTFISNMRSDDGVDCMIIDCIDVKPKISISGISHRKRKLPRLTRIQEPSLPPVKMSILVQTPQITDDGHFINEDLALKSQAHLSEMENDDTDCVFLGSIDVKPKLSINDMSQTQINISRLNEIKKSFLPPLKRIKSQPQPTKIVPVHHYTKTSEVRGFTQEGNFLTTYTESRKETHFFNRINSNNNSYINQQCIQEPQKRSKRGKSNQISIELINSNSDNNILPYSFKNNRKNNNNLNVTKLQSNRNQGNYFICSSCKNIKQVINLYPLNYCLQCTYSIYKMWVLKRNLDIEHNIFAYQLLSNGNLLASLKISSQALRQIIQGHSLDFSNPTDLNLTVCNQYSSRETNEKLAKLILKRSTSIFKGNSIVSPDKAICSKEKVQNDICGSDLGYYKSHLEIQGGTREIYRCRKCGYITRYSHMIKMHIKCHNHGKHKKKKMKSLSSNKHKNSNIYSIDKIDEHENKNSSSQIQTKKDKIFKNRNKRMRKKRELVKPAAKRKETCSLCKYETSSLPELNLHLRSHIPCENSKVNNAELYTTEGNSAIEKNKITIESSVSIREKRYRKSKKLNYAKEDTDNLNKSVFFSSVNLDNSSKCTVSKKVPNKNKVLMGKDNSNKINCLEEHIDEDTVNINDKHTDEEVIINKYMMDINEDSENISAAEKEIYISSDSDASDNAFMNDFDDQYVSQPITDVFKDHDGNLIHENQDQLQPLADDNLLSENTNKSPPINLITECSQSTKTGEFLNIDYYDENELPDLPMESDVSVEYTPVPSPTSENHTNSFKFESEKVLQEFTYFDKTESKIEALSCSECSAHFNKPWNYQRHIKLSHKGCKECSQGKICAYRSSDKHPEMIAIPDPFECSECPYVCTSKGNFMRHMLSHSIEKQLECNVCGYRCTGSGQLQRHMWVHKGGGKNLNFWALSDMY